METTAAAPASEKDAVSRERVAPSGGRTTDDNPDYRVSPSSCSWNSVVRRALARVKIFGDGPELWRGAGARHAGTRNGGLRSSSAVSPKIHLPPVPPPIVFAAAVAREVIRRAELVQEGVDAARGANGDCGPAACDYVRRFVADWRQEDYKIKTSSPPPPWFREKPSGADLIVMGFQFRNSAETAQGGNLRKVFGAAGAKLIESGISRI